MSNAAYLHNLAAPAVVISGAVHGSRRSVKGMVVGEFPGRLPLPWLLAFAPEDVKLVNASFRTGPSSWTARPVLVPVASVGSAVDLVLRRRAELIQLSGDAKIADGYVQRTCDGLSALPLPYLALDPLEVLDLNDAEEPSRLLQRALGTDAAAAKLRLSLSGFQPGATPYSVDMLYANPPDKLADKRRLRNAVALDPNLLPASQWMPTDYEPAPPSKG